MCLTTMLERLAGTSVKEYFNIKLCKPMAVKRVLVVVVGGKKKNKQSIFNKYRPISF